MIILLPENNKMGHIEDSLTPEKLSEWKNLLEMRRVDIYVPKFTFGTKYLLNEDLAAMGMPNAFSPHADLSGIDGSRNLFIQIVVHQAFVDVNEEGTEAAAATGVGVGITSVGPRIPVFRADHPFIFLIQHKESGNILFLGRVSEPGQ
jgi:serpin B